MIDVLEPAGALAAAIPHYEDRPQQRAMARAVAGALAEERALIVEAGTGTGKTLAYLAPALQSGKRVVVSTGTRTLQEQIWRHDIPLLAQMLPQPFSAVTLKGVSNYLCRRRLAELGVLGVSDELRDDLDTIREWVDATATGDRAELEAVADDAAVWQLVTTTSETRLGPRCPHYEACFVTRARRTAEKADLVLVNHHLFFADLALRASYPGARVLPDYDAVIFDEAHQLEDVVTDHFGVAISSVRLAHMVRDTLAVIGRGAATRWTAMVDARRIAANVERRAGELFARVRCHLQGAAAADGGRTELPAALFEDESCRDAWFRLDAALDELACHAALEAEKLADERAEATAALGRRAAAMRDDLATIAEQRRDQYVYWGELRRNGTFLRASPVEVAGLVRAQVLERIPAAVFTSATLSVGGSFAYVRQRLGLDAALAEELAVSSPFDYASQALLYVPRDLPDPRQEPFVEAACARIEELCAITEGRAFVLFTSHRMLRAASARLRARLPYPLLVQGEQPRAALIERFRDRPGSVLLATGGFWEGVDVPGDALSQVIIDKLPFAPPNDPLVAARMRRLEERGDEGFSSYLLPHAALTLKQGFGRLIRRRDDRGIVSVLDGRILSRSYGRFFLATLPAEVPRTGAIEQVRRWWSP